MNTTVHFVAGALLCLLFTADLRAQDNIRQEPPSASIQRKWFAPDFDEMRHQFTFDLGKDEHLVIRMKKLGYWTGADDLRQATAHAAEIMQVYKDSFANEQNTRCLDIHIPASRKNLIARFSQYTEGGNLMTVQGGEAAILKVGTDTLRILQKKKVRNSKNVEETAEIQYTFLLKNISNYSTYARDEAWQNKISTKMDSLVAEYTRRSKKPDVPRHALEVSYDPALNKTTVFQGNPYMKRSQLMIEGGFGVSLIRNTLCPSLDYGVGVYVHKEEDGFMFVRLSMTAFYRFVETSPDHYKAYPTSFVNLELGGQSNRYDPKSLFYRTSLGFGYKLTNKKGEDRDPSMSKEMYRLFFNYSLNKSFVLTPEFVTNFRKNENYNGWLGLTLTFRLF